MSHNPPYGGYQQGQHQQPPSSSYPPQHHQYGMPQPAPPPQFLSSNQYQYQYQYPPQNNPIQVVIPSRPQQQPQPQYHSQPAPQYYQPPNLPPPSQPRSNPHPHPSSQYHQSQPMLQTQSHYQPQYEPQYQPHLQSYSSQQPQPYSQGQPLMASVQHSPRILQDVAPNAPRPHVASKPLPLPDPVPDEPEPDYAILLLTLADEYFEAARQLSAKTDDYYKLVATALGCIESVLNNFKVPALREAQLSLRYAQALYDETDNYDDAERVLTKAIDLCQRNKFLDLKYAMQLLLARVLYRSKPKAAIKDLQAMIEDVEAYRHTAWEYAFRFQHAMFYLATPAVRDLHNAIVQLEKLGNVARHNGDHAVLAFAAVTEAQLHLQTSGPDVVATAQRALAKARALQLNSDVAGNPQMMVMMEFIDLCCSIRESNVSQGEQKRKIMQEVLLNSIDSPDWQDGLLHISLGKRSLSGLQLQDGGLVTERNGKYYLSFSWMEPGDAEALGYLLCAIIAAHKNSHDGHKAEKFVETGLHVFRTFLDKTESASRLVADSTRQRRKTMECRFLIELAFLQCANGRWRAAETTFSAVTKMAEDLDDTVPRSTECILQYLNAVVQQGTGKIDAALHIYQSARFDLSQFQPGSKSSSTSRSQDVEYDTVRNISLLAAMNRLLIIHDPNHPQHQQLPSLLETIDAVIPTSQNKSIHASHSLLLSIINQSTILKAKMYLGEALKAAQAISNAQITALTLTLMQEQLFKGQVGEQAIKCAKAASAQVRKWGDPVWTFVTAGMEADCYDVQGMKVEAARKRVDTVEKLAGLPDDIKLALRDGMS